MVQLKGFFLRYYSIDFPVFQFLNGTIKRNWEYDDDPAALMFQFLNGTIKSLEKSYRHFLFHFRFNS